jgi:hypothetical protein
MGSYSSGRYKLACRLYYLNHDRVHVICVQCYLLRGNVVYIDWVSADVSEYVRCLSSPIIVALTTWILVCYSYT